MTALSDMLQEAAHNGDSAEVERLSYFVGLKSNMVGGGSQELWWAAEEGHVECVKLLIPVCDPKVDKSWALLAATRNGHTECVKLLISVSDPKADDSFALLVAAMHGHTDIVELLIPVSDPKAYGSLALHWGARNDHTECVKLLIPVSDPKALNSGALQAAALNGHNDIVDMLWNISDPQAALAVLCKHHADEKHRWMYVQHKWDAQIQRHALAATVDSTISASNTNNTAKKPHKI